jgi:hypothetical protein
VLSTPEGSSTATSTFEATIMKTVPLPHAPVTLSPTQAALLADIEAFHKQADELAIRAARVRPKGSLETYCRWICSSIWTAGAFLREVEEHGGELAIRHVNWPLHQTESPALVLRPPPAKVVDLAEYRERRAAGRRG